MFDIDKWQEILSTIKKNKLRTFLTGFSVSWGIFMLILLLGSGNGLQNGVKDEFSGDAVNSIWIGGGQTSLAYNGLQPGRNIMFDNADFDAVGANIKNIENLSARLGVWSSSPINYKNEYGTFDLKAVHPNHKAIEAVNMIDGRFINDIDIDNFRKVAVIGIEAKNALFKDENPIGKYVIINGINFKVVGIFSDKRDRENRRLYLPISVIQRIFTGREDVGIITMTSKSNDIEQSREIEANLRNLFSKRKTFSKDDERAIWVSNNLEEFKDFMDLFKAINIFIWVIGVFTIIAGVVGVSNIMLVVVNERTKEIGIRKAIGATPWATISLIIQESIIITAVSGYIGLVLGVVVMEFVANNMPDSQFFKNPGVDISTAIYATIVLVIAGVVASYSPARKAARIRPIEALRHE